MTMTSSRIAAVLAAATLSFGLAGCIVVGSGPVETVRGTRVYPPGEAPPGAREVPAAIPDDGPVLIDPPAAPEPAVTAQPLPPAAIAYDEAVAPAPAPPAPLNSPTYRLSPADAERLEREALAWRARAERLGKGAAKVDADIARLAAGVSDAAAEKRAAACPKLP